MNSASSIVSKVRITRFSKNYRNKPVWLGKKSSKDMIALMWFLQPCSLKLLAAYLVTLVRVAHLVTLPLYLLVSSKMSSLTFFMKWNTGKAKLPFFCFSESSLQQRRPLSIKFLLFFKKLSKAKMCILLPSFLNFLNYIVSKCNSAVLLFKCFSYFMDSMKRKQWNREEKNTSIIWIQQGSETQASYCCCVYFQV